MLFQPRGCRAKQAAPCRESKFLCKNKRNRSVAVSFQYRFNSRRPANPTSNNQSSITSIYHHHPHSPLADEMKSSPPPPPLSPYGVFSGTLFQYSSSPSLTAFESLPPHPADTTCKNKCILIGVHFLDLCGKKLMLSPFKI